MYIIGIFRKINQGSQTLRIFGVYCPVHFIFHLSFFGQSDQKRKNQLSSLFIFCIENLHFTCKWLLIFSFFGHCDQKTKNKKWNGSDIISFTNSSKIWKKCTFTKWSRAPQTIGSKGCYFLSTQTGLHSEFVFEFAVLITS